MGGQGELHLEVIVERIRREHGADVRVGRPQVAYRETVGARLEQDLTYDREIGGKRQFARVRLELSPRVRGAGNAYEDAAVRQARESVPRVPEAFLAAFREGVTDALTRGPLLGYPVVDVEVRVVDVGLDESDSSEASCRAVAAIAVGKALEGGPTRLLEPVMQLEVVAPDQHTGAVHSDLSTRRGRVLALEPRAGAQVLTAEAPLAEMVGYATALRSATQGRASYTMRFARYSEVPADLQESIVKKVRGY
jgi:elongation factor G